jgi:hypothetical protein
MIAAAIAASSAREMVLVIPTPLGLRYLITNIEKVALQKRSG